MYDVLSRANRDNVRIERRDFLKSAAAAMSLIAMGKNNAAVSGTKASWLDGTLDYLETLRRADGGCAWPEQMQSHLTPSYAVTGCYNLLERTPPDKDRLIRFIRENHPFRIKKLDRDLKVFEFNV